MVKARRSLCILLGAALALGLLPAGAKAVTLQAGMPTFAVNTDSPTIIGFGGKQWMVIGYDGAGVAGISGALTLFMNSGITEQFNALDGNNQYNGSYLQRAMNLLHNALPEKEQTLVIPRTLVGGSENAGQTGYNNDHIAGNDANASFWPLSVKESDAVNQALRVFPLSWWLRTPGNANNKAAVFLYEAISESGGHVASNLAVCPAFHLDLSSVFFTSSAGGTTGKSAATPGGGLTRATAPTGAVKFTAQHTDLTLVCTDASARVAQSGAEISIAYSNASTGANCYVSCVIEDGSSEVLFYGKLVDCADGNSAGSANLSLPAAEDLPEGSYTLKLLSEEANGDNFTDFCSAPISIPLVIDNTPPVLSSGSAHRTGASTATVTFTSSESGQYYCAAVPSMSTSGQGVACDAAETTLSLTSLTKEAKELYIIVKDEAGNESTQKLKISIPAFVPDIEPPTVITNPIASLTFSGATLTGTVTADGGSAVTERGFIYGPAADPAIGDAGVTQVASGAGMGAFSTQVSRLSGNATYHVRAYAINSEAINYGADPLFTTPPAPSPDPAYLLRTLTDPATGVIVTGLLRTDATLTVASVESSAACDTFFKKLADKSYTVLFSGDIHLSRDFIGTLTVSIPAASVSNGRAVTILHCVQDTLETHTATVWDGKVTFTTTNLSAIAVLAQVDEPSENQDLPKTGDVGVLFYWVLAMALSGPLCFMLLRRKSRGAG